MKVSNCDRMFPFAVAAIRNGKYNHELIRGVLMDVGLEGLIKKFEEYLGRKAVDALMTLAYVAMMLVLVGTVVSVLVFLRNLNEAAAYVVGVLSFVAWVFGVLMLVERGRERIIEEVREEVLKLIEAREEFLKLKKESYED